MDAPVEVDVESHLRRQKQKLLILWGALSATMLMYALILYVMVGKGGPFAQGSKASLDQASFFVRIFPPLATILAVISWVLRRKLLAAPMLESHVQRILSSYHQSKISKKKSMSFLSLNSWYHIMDELPPKEHIPYVKLKLYATAHLLSWALHESIMILGFVLGVVGTDFMKMIPYVLMGLALNVLSFPRLENFLRNTNE